MTDKELAFLLLKHALRNRRRDAEDYFEVNSVPELREAGNARIANMLELLGKHQLVSDVQPTFSEHGLGFAYRLETALVGSLTDDEVIHRKVGGIFDGATSETAVTLSELFQVCSQSNLNAIYRDDLLASIKELRTCFSNECYIACLALSGKILEICLKQALIDNEVEFNEKWMIGQLIQAFKDANLHQYLDQSLSEIAKIINQSRIPAVHAKERIPVPSKNQAIMVIHAVVDTVNRVIVSP